jgi:hypothetical protein
MLSDGDAELEPASEREAEGVGIDGAGDCDGVFERAGESDGVSDARADADVVLELRGEREVSVEAEVVGETPPRAARQRKSAATRARIINAPTARVG